MSPSPPPARSAVPTRLPRPGALALLVALVAMACCSCVLAEGTDYTVQPAPPNGVHVTVHARPTRALVLVSDLVAAGVPVDAALVRHGYHLSCDHQGASRVSGDRCAFSVLRATPVGGPLARAAAHLGWRQALASRHLPDFASDALGAVRRNGGGCAHVTIRRSPAGTSANWTWRPPRSHGC